jgi:hypothetical protein
MIPETLPLVRRAVVRAVSDLRTRLVLYAVVRAVSDLGPTSTLLAVVRTVDDLRTQRFLYAVARTVSDLRTLIFTAVSQKGQSVAEASWSFPTRLARDQTNAGETNPTLPRTEPRVIERRLYVRPLCNTERGQPKDRYVKQRTRDYSVQISRSSMPTGGERTVVRVEQVSELLRRPTPADELVLFDDGGLRSAATCRGTSTDTDTDHQHCEEEYGNQQQPEH